MTSQSSRGDACLAEVFQTVAYSVSPFSVTLPADKLLRQWWSLTEPDLVLSTAAAPLSVLLTSSWLAVYRQVCSCSVHLASADLAVP